VSQHLKVLRQAGLVRGEVDGLHICYCADVERLARAAELLSALTEASPRQETVLHGG
jgi:DNA-binding transcriptional ArsR family regulator